MDNFVEVFIFTQSKNEVLGEDVFRFLIGCVALVIGFFLIAQVKHKEKEEKVMGIFRAIFVLFWAIIWSSISGLVLFSQLNEYSNIMDIYNNGTYSVVEGKVKVIHEEPSGGHDEGDIISVGGTEFEFSYYSHFFYYHQTISHGGVLRDGVYVRLTYIEDSTSLVENPIIRVELLEAQ